MKEVHVTTKVFFAGVCEEYNVRRILFDIATFREEFGPGNPLLLIQRPGEAQSYPVTPEVEGDYAVWIPQQQDTDIPGTLKLVLQWYTEDGLAISADYYGRISGAKSSAGEVPEPEERWYRDVLQAGEDAKSCAQRAEDAAERAESAASGIEPGGGSGSGGDGGSFVETDPTVPSWAKQPEKPAYTAFEVGADKSGTAQSLVSDHNTDDTAHNDMRLLIQALADRLNALADSDDTTLDQMSEVVAYIKSNKSLIDAVTTSKVSVSDIVDDLVTNVSNKPLSAAQGVVIKGLIDALQNGKLSTDDLQNAIHTALAQAKASGEFDGKTAYQYAVDGGYTGSEEEFAEKMAQEIPTVDNTLTVSGAAADAKETGDRLSALSDGIENLGNGQTGSLSYRLKGKTVVFFGDSVCAGTTSSGGYAELIGSMTGCTVINKGVSGATIANAGTSTTKIVDVVKQYEGDADYFCIEGFANDYNQGVPLGTVTSGYNDTLDETTFAGALESICQSLLSHTTAKVVAVVTHNCTMPDTQNADTGLTLRSYHDTAMEIYQKYGIKVYDAFLESGLNTGYSSSTSLPAFAKALADTYTVDGDKVHPNQQGYEKYYVRQIIDVLSDGDIYDIVNSSESPSTPVTYECDFSITGFVRNNGTISTAAGSGTYGHKRTDYIPMDGVTSITLNVGGYSSAYYISFFDSSKTCITSLSRTISDNYGDVSETIEIDSSYSEAAYFVISHYNMAGYTGDFEPTASYVVEG